jgi:hypothetical protein
MYVRPGTFGPYYVIPSSPHLPAHLGRNTYLKISCSYYKNCAYTVELHVSLMSSDFFDMPYGCKSHFKLIWVHLVVCLTRGPKPLPKRALHIVRSRASSFRCEYPLPSWRSSSSFLRLLPRLPVTSFPPFIFPSITCRRRQFVRSMWPFHLSFRLGISCRIFLCTLNLSIAFF